MSYETKNLAQQGCASGIFKISNKKWYNFFRQTSTSYPMAIILLVVRV